MGINTFVTYDDTSGCVPKTAKVLEITHRRKLHTESAREQAAKASGYTDKAEAVGKGATICNHALPYAGVMDYLVSGLKGQEVQEALRIMYESYDLTLGATWGARMKNVMAVNTVVERQALGEVIGYFMDYYINSPSNLFYWDMNKINGDGGGKTRDYPNAELDKDPSRTLDWRADNWKGIAGSNWSPGEQLSLVRARLTNWGSKWAGTPSIP